MDHLENIPWTVRQFHDGFSVVDSDNWVVGQWASLEFAQFIAAAPDLLAELTLIVEGWDAIESNKIRQLSDWEIERREFARAALVGAIGEK